MANTGFDPNSYQRSLPLTLGTAIALIDALVTSQPRPTPPLAKKTLKKLEDIRKIMGDTLASRHAQEGLAPQAVDQVADRAWRALRKSLEAYLDLQPEFAPEQETARALETLLFGEAGLAFTVLTYAEQRVAMHDRLEALKQNNRFEALVRLVGKPCVDNLLSAVKAYDAMVVSLLQNIADEEQLLPLVRDVQKLVTDYARYIVGTVDEDDPETVSVAARALAPIDNIRRVNLGRKDNGNADVK